MPFKLRLNRARAYKVVSRSVFVMSVELLDGVVVECTLGADSTGQECLDNVCQRLVMAQPELFGLRYVSRGQQPRWVQLDRPLKRQLDKYAASHQLYLRVMYYVVSGTGLITDEVTRYHYFLQLKNDLMEGRIVCDCQQAVVLASYSRQAEYGNHDRERHTVEYLKNLLSFPKQMIDGGQIIDGSALAETGRLEWLTAAVIQHHMALHNMSQAQAEEGYISACQLLSGYGQETFVARDHLKQSEVMIAISLTGIMVAMETSETPHVYRWTDITNVINHKRTFSIECQSQSDNATFVLPTPEDGKYIWRMCVLQHTFYMKHQQALLHSNQSQEEMAQPKFQDNGLWESREELDAVAAPLGPAQRAHSTSCLELVSSEPQHPQHRHQLRALLPTYRAAPDYETAIQQKYQEQRAQVVRYPNHPTHQATGMVNSPPKPMLYGSHPDIHRQVHYPDVTRHTVSQGVASDDYFKLLGRNPYPFAINPNVQTELNPQMQYINVYKPPPPYPSGLASNSTPDLAVASQALAYHRGYINSHVSGSSPDLVSTRTALNRQYLGYLQGTNPQMVNYGRVNVMPNAHGTYNNLSSVMGVPSPHVILDPHHISDNIQKVYDERGNIMYSMPMHRVPYPRIVLPQNQLKLTDAQEPIYENVPLPWQNEHDKVTIRDRAQSLTAGEEITKMTGRNSSHPTISPNSNVYDRTPNFNMPSVLPTIKVNTPYSGDLYVNAHIIKDVINSSGPKDLNISNKSINKTNEIDNVTLTVDRISISKNENEESDDTPYQSLSTHKLNVSNNNTLHKDNVTSIHINSAPDVTHSSTCLHNNSGSSGVESALTNLSALNSTQFSNSLDLESSVNTTKSNTLSNKEKKRRRWGVFIGRATKNVDVKSATLGRDKSKLSANIGQEKHRWSTGLPKYQPLPPSITKETLCQLLERKMSDTQLSFAFEHITKGRESNGDMTTALYPENSALNGYSLDNLPYEDNRVKLSSSHANKHGYINASHITMTVGNSQRFYVIARVPTANRRPPKLTTTSVTTEQEAALVWECVWQVGGRVVALVAGEEHPPYLPEQGKTLEFGKYRVHTEWKQQSDFGYTCRVRLTCSEKPPRSVWHVHFTEWPETTIVPDSDDHFLSFLSELGGLRAACACEALPPHGGNAPLVLGCTGGAGRSGTALAADLLLHTLDHNQELDIPRTVGLLHQQRANMIQNVHQYRFLHKILLLYLKQSRLI